MKSAFLGLAPKEITWVIIKYCKKHNGRYIRKEILFSGIAPHVGVIMKPMDRAVGLSFFILNCAFNMDKHHPSTPYVQFLPTGHFLCQVRFAWNELFLDPMALQLPQCYDVPNGEGGKVQQSHAHKLHPENGEGFIQLKFPQNLC